MGGCCFLSFKQFNTVASNRYLTDFPAVVRSTVQICSIVCIHTIIRYCEISDSVMLDVRLLMLFVCYIFSSF